MSVMTFTSRLFGRAKILSSVVPVEPLIQRLVHHIYSPRWQPTFVAKFILYSLAVEVLQLVCIQRASVRGYRPIPRETFEQQSSAFPDRH